MAGLVAEASIWTQRNQVAVSDSDLSCHSYREKEDSASFGSPYSKERKYYFESKGRPWSLSNKRPEKLRDGLKEFEEHLQKAACISTFWLTPDIVLLVLENGCILRIELASEYGDIQRVIVDTSVVGKLTVGVASDALMTDRYVVFASSEKAKLDVFYFSKPIDLGSRKPDKLAALEPVLHPVDLPGRVGRALSRRLSLSFDLSCMLVWWPTAGADAWPWTPVPSEADSANLAVVRLTLSEAAVICYARTDCEPLHAVFSRRNASHIFTVETSLNLKTPPSAAAAARVDLCTYELTSSCLHRTTHNRVSMRGGLYRAAWSSDESRVLLVSEARHCMVCDELGNQLAQSTIDVLPVQALWHPNDSIIILASSQGDVQVVDSSLNPISIHLLRSGDEMSGLRILHLSTYFRPDVRLQRLSWGPREEFFSASIPPDAFLVVFESGPACLVRLTSRHVDSRRGVSSCSVVAQYLKCGQTTQAVNLLNGMSWQEDASRCYACLSMIVNHLFKMPLDKTNEVLIEATLGSFYAPQKPLPDIAILEYRDSIGRLARRFFHHLLRYSRFDKAFLLAIDIGSRDLFMDIHNTALDKGDHALATIARDKANQCKGGLFGAGVEISSDDGISTDGSCDESSTSSQESMTTPFSPEKASMAALWPLQPPSALAEPSTLDSFPGYMPSHKLAARTASTDSTRGPAPPLPPRRSKALQPPQGGNGQQADAGAQSPTGRAQQHRQAAGITLPGYSYETDADLTNQLLDDYMALMVDDPLAFCPKEQSPKGAETGETGAPQQALKVIHFGVV